MFKFCLSTLKYTNIWEEIPTEMKLFPLGFLRSHPQTPGFLWSSHARLLPFSSKRTIRRAGQLHPRGATRAARAFVQSTWPAGRPQVEPLRSSTPGRKRNPIGTSSSGNRGPCRKCCNPVVNTWAKPCIHRQGPAM